MSRQWFVSRGVLWTAFQNGQRSDPGAAGLSNSLQHCDGIRGKVGATGSIWAAGSAEWVGVGGIRAQHSVICSFVLCAVTYV